MLDILASANQFEYLGLFKGEEEEKHFSYVVFESYNIHECINFKLYIFMHYRFDL